MIDDIQFFAGKSHSQEEFFHTFNTLLDGADGLVLAAETAIGAHPIGCANMIVKLVKEYEQRRGQRYQFDSGFGATTSSLLIEPHGGKLIDCHQISPEPQELDRLQRLRVNEKTLVDCEQLAVGTYSPLQGFMDREAIESVLTHHRLPDNNIWTTSGYCDCEENIFDCEDDCGGDLLGLGKFECIGSGEVIQIECEGEDWYVLNY